MREITQVQEYEMRGERVAKKIEGIIRSGTAKEILVEDGFGSIVIKISPDIGFMKPTLDMVRGAIKVIKCCRLVVMERQPLLF